MHHLLLLEDDPDIRLGIVQHFTREGVRLDACETGRDALRVLTGPEGAGLDAAILDLTLPDMDGLDVLKIIRHHPQLRNLPVVVVTARGEVIDRILGLELGADDYITKPFSMRELAARVKAVLRRTVSGANSEAGEHTLLAQGKVRMDLDAYAAWVEEREIEMTRLEFELLAFLLQNPNRVLTRQKLLKEVWGLDHSNETRTVDAHIRRLRMKLGAQAELIETVIGVGYKLNPPAPQPV